jgi:hypothetical protein
MGHFSLSTSHSLTCQINPNQANSSRGFTTLKPKLFCKRARSCKYGVFQIVRESDKGTAVSKTLNVSKASKLLLVPPFFLPHGILHHTARYCTVWLDIALTASLCTIPQHGAPPSWCGQCRSSVFAPLRPSEGRSHMRSLACSLGLR